MEALNIYNGERMSAPLSLVGFNKVKLIGLGVDATSSPKTLLTTILDGSVKSMTWSQT